MCFEYFIISDLNTLLFLSFQLSAIIAKLTEEKNSALEQNRKLRDELVSICLKSCAWVFIGTLSSLLMCLNNAISFYKMKNEYHVEMHVEPLSIGILLQGVFERASSCIAAAVYKH